MKKKYLRKLIRKIISQLLIIVLITNSLLPFKTSSFAQESTDSAEVAITPEPTPTTELSPTSEPSPTVKPTPTAFPTETVKPTPTVLITPTSEPTATPSATIVPTPITTSTPTPVQSIEPTSSPVQSTPTVSPTPEIAPPSQSTVEALQNFIKESSSSAGVIDYAIKLPFSGSYPVSLGFGETPDDPYLQEEYKSFGIVAHDGIDYEMPDNTNVLAVDRGVVLSAGPGIYGTTVTIYHTWGMTYYGHLSTVSVEPGQIVETGDLIGYSGHTGLATGPHLHFAIKPHNPDLENGFHGMVNPNIYLGLKPQSNILGATTILLNKQTRFFKSTEKAEFEINTKDKNLRYKLTDSSGQEITFSKKISKKNDKNILSIDQPQNFRPGKYVLEVTDSFGQTETIEFYWGVLVINTNKSVYLAGDTAYLQMASLNEYGNTLCDSNLKLEITDTSGQTTTSNIEKSGSCANNNITDDPDYFTHYQTTATGTYQMKLKNLDNNFEISDSFEVKTSLPFEVERIAATRINPFSSDYKMTIKVKANEAFKGYIIEKKPDDFQIINSKFGWNVDMQKDEEQTFSYVYQAPKISPQIFSLGPLRLTDELGQVIFSESRQWQLAADEALTATAVATGNWSAAATWRSVGSGTVSTSGNTATLTGSGTAFTTELIGNEALYNSDCTTNINGFATTVSSVESGTSLTMSRKHNNMTSRSYCASGVPHDIDAAVINAGVTVTVTANATIASVTISNPTTANGLSINTGVTLTVTGALTLNANSTANAETVTLNGSSGGISAGSIVVNAPSSSGSNNITCAASASETLSASGTISITGGSTAAQTGTSTITGLTCTVSAAGITINGGSVTNATLNSTTGTITTTNGITFGGTAAQAKLTTTGAGTINLAGTLGANGTLAINSGTTLYTTNTSAINGAYTLGKVTVSSGTTTLGAILTFAGNLTVASAAILTMDNFQFTESGTSDITGTVNTATGNTGTRTFTGLVTIQPNGVWDLSGQNPATSFNAGITHNGTTFNNGTGAVTFSASQALGGSSAMTFGQDPTTIPAGVTLTNNNTNAVTGVTFTALTLANPTTANGLSLTNGSIITITNALTFTANSTANNETVTLNGTGGISAGSIVMNAPSSSGNNNLTCAGTGNLITSGTITITGGSTASQTGKSTITGLTCTVSAAGITINGGSVTDATLNSTTGTITTTNGITFGGTAAQAKLTTTNGATINLTGTLGSGGTLSINSATTLVSTGVSGIAGAYTIGKLTVSSGTLTQTAAVVAAGDVSINGAVLASNGNLFTAQANYTNNGTHSGSGGVTVSGASSVIDGSGTVSNTGTFTVSGATAANFKSTASITIQGKLLVSGAITVTNNGAVTLNTAAASLDGDNANSNFTNAATGTLNLTGSIFSTNGTLTANSSGNTVNYNGAVQTVKATTYHDIILGGSNTKTITNLTTVDGDFTLTGTAATTNAGTLAITGTLTATGTTFTNDGTLTVTAGLAGVGGTFVNSATGTLNYGATAAPTVATFTTTAVGNTVNYSGANSVIRTVSYHHLGLTGSGTVTGANFAVTAVAGNLSTSGTVAATTGANLNITGSLSIGANTSLTTGAFTLSVGTTTTIASGGSLIFSSSTNPGKTFTGNVTVSGVWNEQAAITPEFKADLTNNATTWTASTGAHTFSGAGKTISGTTETIIDSVSISGTVANSNTLIVATLLTVGGTLTNNGTINAATSLAGVGSFINEATGTLNYGGSTVDVGTFTVNTSGNKVNYNSTSAAQTVKAATYHDLTITKSSQTATLGDDTIVEGDLNIASGTLDVDTSNNYSLNVAGNWTNNGTFEKRQGLVTLNGTGGSEQIIAGSTSFYDLIAIATTARTLTFTAGTTQTVTHALNFSGDSGQVITLRSSSSSKWNINTTGISPTLTYLSVTNSHSTQCLVPTNSSGSKNYNWDFVGTGCVNGPNLDQLMRHGTWFSDGVKQPFTF